MLFTVADLRGTQGTPPPDRNSFNFMQFLGKYGPHLGEILDPPLV